MNGFVCVFYILYLAVGIMIACKRGGGGEGVNVSFY